MNGNDGYLVRAIRGPITLITVGVLFALNNFTSYHFNQTWPVILIVFGLLSLLRRGTEGVPPPAPFPPPPGSYGFPPPGTGTSGYRQSSYTGTTAPAPFSDPPASGPAKGGFGTSAPPRPDPPSGDAV
jgi:hypothetical protein